MTHQHEDQVGISITTLRPDGSAHIRRWYVTPTRAQALADELGPPDREVLATAEAGDKLTDRVASLPGLVITSRERP